MRRVLATMLVITMLVGISVSHVNNTTVKACSECEYINDLDWNCDTDAEYDENFVSTVSTDTMNDCYGILEELSQEEFDDIFCTSEYEKEFDKTYNVVTRGEGKFDKFKDKLSNMSDEAIDKLSDNLFNKLPKFIKEKYNITKKVTKATVKVLIQRLDDSKLTTSILAAAITKVTGIPVIYVKPVLDIVIHTLDKFINDKDKDDVSETPCVVQFPTPTPTALPTQVVSAEPTLEPIVEPTMAATKVSEGEETKEPVEIEVPTEEPTTTDELQTEAPTQAGTFVEIEN